MARSEDINGHWLVVRLTDQFTLNVIGIKQSAHFNVMTIGLLGNSFACTLSSKLNMELGISLEKPQGWITGGIGVKSSCLLIMVREWPRYSTRFNHSNYHRPSLISPIFQGHLRNSSLGDCSESSHDWLEKLLRVTAAHMNLRKPELYAYWLYVFVIDEIKEVQEYTIAVLIVLWRHAAFFAQTALPVPIALSSKSESNTLRLFGVMEKKLMIVSLRILNSKSVGLPKNNCTWVTRREWSTLQFQLTTLFRLPLSWDFQRAGGMSTENLVYSNPQGMLGGLSLLS